MTDSSILTNRKLEKLLKDGEGFTVEFKKCKNALPTSVFETVCSFSNRYGGFILLGVDDSGNVLGVEQAAVKKIKTDFINILNNPNKIRPSLFLNLEEYDYEGKTILWVYVPVNSDVEFCDGKVFDRNGDADQDITKSVDLVANLYNRKSHDFYERMLLPYATLDHLRLDLIPKVKQLVQIKNTLHPWKMEFVQKHTDDRFFLVDNFSTSVRDKIAREVVVNTLVHREYSSAYPAKLIITKDSLYTENWNRSTKFGRLTPENFTPYPKNPLIAKFFMELGMADTLGSGVRNLYKFTKIYSSTEPILEEGDVFKTTVLLENGGINKEKLIENRESSQKIDLSDDGVNVGVNEERIFTLIKANANLTAHEASEKLNISKRQAERLFAKLKEKNIIRRVGADKGGHWEIIQSTDTGANK